MLGTTARYNRAGDEERGETDLRRQRPRVYADTSVFGGVFDEEFSRPSRLFFDLVHQGKFDLVLSEVVRRELAGAPDTVFKRGAAEGGAVLGY